MYNLKKNEYQFLEVYIRPNQAKNVNKKNLCK